MSARTKARKRALDILFSADVRGDKLSVALAAEAKRAASEPARQASWLYAREIVDGVIDHAEEIDEQISTHSRDWKLDRMPTVDRALLRIATWEILFNDAVPTAVAIDEAVDLAKEFSTDDSGAFVHGVLARIARS
ncbi:transcription antitermination factor NusB [Microbacterium paludicola]|uniref:Transcription antitermination protein NusB n=1 Tax=Microbacterium paludicola TaxID=300019 RepID=A0A4Y9FZ03_9MICO|nr:transcription antitermination factor NusB [Microbacterium paludicola]MBF0815378.1 transcription antitermination factor NusB [Microbacterium paludicola]TFU33919.1 transcription antitermination factor NusB [Microbacterium paludicola]